MNPAGSPGVVGAVVFDAAAEQKAAKEKFEQQASMERFRQMLQPSLNPNPAPDTRYFSAAKPAVDPNLTQPDFVPNPAGASFTPLSSSLGRPTGLTPLPGIIAPHAQPATIPSWKPQPPPWLSQSPVPTSFPLEKF
jgi:hypothetical protein